MSKIGNLIKKMMRRDAGSSSSGDVTTWPWPDVITGSITEPALAMKLSTVYRCVDIVSKSIGLLPLQISRITNGYRDIDEKNPINYLLQFKPNARQTAFDFKRNAIIQMLMQGNAYIYPYFVDGELKNLYLISPGACTYDKYQDTYTISDLINHLYGVFDSDEIIHLKNTSLDGGFMGESTIHYAAYVLGIAKATDNQQNDMFQTGSTLRGFISGDEAVTKGMGKVQDEQLKTVGSRLENEISSGKKIFPLPGIVKFSQLSLSPADLQLLDSKRFNVLEICRFFGVHPDKVFSGQSQNYKASDMAQVSYMSDTLQPIIAQIENEFQTKLIPPSLSYKYSIKFDTDAFYQINITEKADYMTKTISAGVMTPNEWRKREGKPPLDGGDQAFISCNVAPIDSAKIKGESTGPAQSENISQKGSGKVPPKTD